MGLNVNRKDEPDNQKISVRVGDLVEFSFEGTNYAARVAKITPEKLFVRDAYEIMGSHHFRISEPEELIAYDRQLLQLISVKGT